MGIRPGNRIMMISTHGYVAARPELGKPDTGGQVVYVLELSKCLARLGYRVDILTRRFEKQPAVERVAERVRILRFPCGGKQFIPKEILCYSIPEWVNNLKHYIESKKLRYAFINTHYWDAGLAGLALSRYLNIPHIHTPHSLGTWKRKTMNGDPKELDRKYNFPHRIREEKVIYDEADLLIATTPQQRDLLQEDYDVPAGKIRVIPPGYDDTRFFPVSLATRRALKQDLNIPPKTVLALGRIARNKGYDLLIQAMPAVLKRVPDAYLLLAVGSTDPTQDEIRQVDELKELAKRLGVADRVLFRDYIPDELLADYYRAADVFALSSRYEPFGMTAVEAMACGTPTVITVHGGLWEQVRWGLEAIYADPTDPEAFGIALAMVLQYPRLRDQLALYGSQLARTRFTWMGIAQQLLRSLDGLDLPVRPEHSTGSDQDAAPSGACFEEEEP